MELWEGTRQVAPLTRTYIGTEPLHPSEVLPTAIALCEENGRNGRDLIEAMVAGYEASMRVNDAINGAYKNAPKLPNPPNDAADVAAVLGRSGFDIIFETNLDQIGMQDASIRFSREARTADVALFYYSGHALQFAGINYLVPVDAILRDEADLRRMARADEILADLQQAKNLRIRARRLSRQSVCRGS